jgi:hypothetical protein
MTILNPMISMNTVRKISPRIRRWGNGGLADMG